MKTFFGAPHAVALSLLLGTQAQALPSNNKASAISAMTDIFTRQDASAVGRYFTSPYRQHNTRIPDGLEALQQLAQLATTWPDVHTSIRRALSDGDLVVLHSEYWNLLNRHQTALAFDLFRFNKDGKIVEHWDALEPLAKADDSGHTQIDGSTEIRDVEMTESNRLRVFAYIDQVMIAGNIQEKSQFLDIPHYVDHQPSRPRTFDANQPDLSGSVKLDLSKLHYVARHRSVAEGNFVFVQGEARLNAVQIVEVYDLFRLEHEIIVEHWVVHARVPAALQRANSNGPF